MLILAKIHNFAEIICVSYLYSMKIETQFRQSILLIGVILVFNGCLGDSKDKSGADNKKSSSENLADSFKSAQQGGFKQLVNDFEDKSRVIWQKPDLVIQLLGDVRNKTVADIGAGTGYFSFRVLPKAKKVIAIDIDKRFITFMDSVRAEMPVEMRPRFEARLVAPDNPQLQNGEADHVIIVNTYMYIENRVEYLKVLKNGISKGGKVLIIDYKQQTLPVGPPSNIKVAMSEVVKELKSVGFTKITTDETTLDYQYIITADNG